MSRALPALLLAAACDEPAFVGGRAPLLCADGYALCGLTAACTLDADRYVEGRFPGSLRVVIDPGFAPARVDVLLHFLDARSAGTELLVQLREPDCTVDPAAARAWLVDQDPIALAGPDRTLVLPDLTVHGEGEHLLEVYADADARFLLVAAPRPAPPSTEVDP